MEFQKFSTEEYLKLPHQPGVYKFFNQENIIIYVGKAKDLVKRVSSYFTKTDQGNRKTVRLVREIAWIEFVIVNSEFDALLLENSLIKENQPKYNILLKDDKTFPSILITNERFPRIFSTRRIIPSQGEYFGPYTSVKAMNNVLDLIRKLYTIRTCSLNLSKANVDKKKYKVCLEYHIGNCLGPCEGLQEEGSYLQDIQSAKEILKGNVGLVRSQYKALMQQAAEALKYEIAHSYKVKLDYLEKFQSKSLIVNPKISNTDVLGVIADGEKFFINYMRIEDGSIRVSETFEAKRRLDEPENELLQIILFNIQKKYSSVNTEVLCNKAVASWGTISVINPKIGDKRKLVDLSLKNALYFRNEKAKRLTEVSTPGEKVLEQLQSDLGLDGLPKHIECFDNSNIQGTNPVSSMVCFKNGKPSKKDYRKYSIRTVEGPDDFASMREVVGRRYKRLLSEKEPLPDLIIVDGGKGQLSSACEALKEIGVYGQIPIIGIAKRLEEIYYPEDPVPLHISKKSSGLKLLQYLRDEAHRFAITFHRTKRSKESIKSSLDLINGIGPSTKSKLLQHFKSVKRMEQASPEELEKIVGKSKAAILSEAINKKGDQN